MRVLVTARFEKDCGALPRGVRDRVEEVWPRIGEAPILGKRLSGRLAGKWAWRLGEYRVIYRVEGDVVTLTGAGHRREVYR